MRKVFKYSNYNIKNTFWITKYYSKQENILVFFSQIQIIKKNFKSHSLYDLIAGVR